MTTIEEIEGVRWGDPPPGSSFLVTRCHELRRKDLADFTVEDMRVLLGQEIAVPALLPMAVDVLVRELLAEGDFYPGDLLSVVLRLPEAVWRGCPELRTRLVHVLERPLAAGEIADDRLRRQISELVGEWRAPT